MNSSSTQIQEGMDVFGSDGEKIGSVADVYSDTTGMGGSSPIGGQTGAGTPFPGTLGNESEVTTGQTPYPDTLGNQSEATASQTPFPGTLGNESEVKGGSGSGSIGDASANRGPDTLGQESTTGIGTGGSGTTDTEPIAYEEIDMVVVEEIPAGDLGTGTGDTGRFTGGGTTGTQAGYAGGSGTTGTQTAIGTGYIKIDSGGFLGFGTKELFVPFNAIQHIDPGSNAITLNTTKDNAEQTFNQKPPFMEQGS